jgi:hypothetical protein
VIKDELAAYTANIIKRVGAEQAEVLFRGQIGEAGRVAGKALRRGQVSPRFALPSATGAIVSLEERLSYGPIILTFYRGGWCCAYRELNPAVLMMQSAEDRPSGELAEPLDRPMARRILTQGQMRSNSVVIAGVGSKNPSRWASPRMTA